MSEQKIGETIGIVTGFGISMLKDCVGVIDTDSDPDPERIDIPIPSTPHRIFLKFSQFKHLGLLTVVFTKNSVSVF